MKIRIHNNSVRLRLDRDEVDLIGEGSTVGCKTHFPGGAVFEYQLSVSDVATVRAKLTGSCIEVLLPPSIARKWAKSESEVSIHGEGDLALLIEKDFECLDPRDGEDQGNRFPNPKSNA